MMKNKRTLAVTLSRKPLLALALLCLTSACRGSLDGEGPKPGEGAGGSKGEGGGNGGGDDDDGVLAPACGPEGDGLTLRRLTRDEYDNTLRDLLGDVGSPGRSFPADITNAGFDNNVSTLKLPPVLTEQYEATAERVIDDVWAREAQVPANQRRLRVCEPSAGKEKQCGQQILQAFMPRAWRRPVKVEEVETFLTAIDLAKEEGETAEAGVKLALQAVLMSPHFLFRIEADADPKTLNGQFALASRLSYFLWGTMPDQRLFELAAQQTLSKPEVLRAEAKRMLGDAKAIALTQLFAGQWLDLRVVEAANPDSRVFPDFKTELKRAMRLETERFFEAFLHEDLSALDMLDAKFTFMNDDLKQHYGVFDVAANSKDMSRVTLPANSKRSGLFGHGSFLMLTSMPDRTSIIKRGDWVLKHLTCEPPPAPPPNVPALKNAGEGMAGGSLRERTEQHRADPACSGCHEVMDPIGFGLENYDAIGRWRETEPGAGAIDASGEYKGKKFSGPQELASLIKADPAFASCLVEKVYTYALGKSKGTDDERVLEELGKAFAAKQHRMADLITEIVAHPRFLSPCGS